MRTIQILILTSMKEIIKVKLFTSIESIKLDENVEENRLKLILNTLKFEERTLELRNRRERRRIVHEELCQKSEIRDKLMLEIIEKNLKIRNSMIEILTIKYSYYFI